ncbi:MAG TPA: 50S ribosomal protein L1 [Armatimonadota bacterium]
MPKHGKRYDAVVKTVEKGKHYSIIEALELAKKNATAKFDETIEVAIELGVDPRHGDQMVRGTASLPFGTGKHRRVAVFAKGDAAKAAEEAGADVVGDDDLVKKIQEGWREFDVLVAAPDMMKTVGQLGRLLGPRMPSPKAGTVTPNVGQIVKDIKSASRVEYRVEKAGIVHMAIGKASFPVENLKANLAVLLTALLKARPAAAKGRYFKDMTITSTMGPGIQVEAQAVLFMAEGKVIAQ